MKSWKRETVETGWHLLVPALFFPQITKRLHGHRWTTDTVFYFLVAGAVYHMTVAVQSALREKNQAASQQDRTTLQG